jgi:2-dehydro-3-deoxygalactonokinase
MTMIKNILSCDWGTSNFRLRLVDLSDGSVVGETIDNKGIAVVYKDWLESGLDKNARIGYFKTVLLAYIKKMEKQPLTGVPLIISGMASSSMGMMELPYQQTPFILKKDKLNIHKIPPDENFDHEIWLVSGLRTADDVMRGEETMLMGLGVEKTDRPQLFIITGTHSKQVLIQDCVVKDFKTYMTGELFDLMRYKSMLAGGLEADSQLSGKDEAFIQGVFDSNRGNLLNCLFRIRTNELFKRLTKRENFCYLSGMLIGEELKSIHGEDYDMINLVSGGKLLSLYVEALSALGFKNRIRTFDADRALVDGQVSIFKSYQQIFHE